MKKAFRNEAILVTLMVHRQRARSGTVALSDNKLVHQKCVVGS